MIETWTWEWRLSGRNMYVYLYICNFIRWQPWTAFLKANIKTILTRNALILKMINGTCLEDHRSSSTSKKVTFSHPNHKLGILIFNDITYDVSNCFNHKIYKIKCGKYGKKTNNSFYLFIESHGKTWEW